MIKNRRKRKTITRNGRFVRYTDFGKKRKKSFSGLFKGIVKLCICACFVAAGFYGYKFTLGYLYACDKLLIEDIEVIGCNNVTKTEIKELIPFKEGDNLVKVDLSKAEKEMLHCKSELKDINMTRKWMSKKIMIVLEERHPEAFVQKDGKMSGLDFDNIPFTLRGNMFNMKVPVLACSSDKYRFELLKFLKILKPYAGDFISRITEIKIGPDQDIIFVVDNKTIVYWGSIKKNSINDKIKKMISALEDALNKYGAVEYMDLTFLDENKNKIILKPAAKQEINGREIVQNQG